MNAAVAARAAAAIAALAVVAACAGCAHQGALGISRAGRAPRRESIGADSVTVALWSMNETGGPRAIDSGAHGLDGISGLETRTDFGRFGRARVFRHSLDSFVFVPSSPDLDTPRDFTIEAWVNLSTYGDYEDTPIAARWVPQTGERSWLFTVVGRRLVPPVVPTASPGDHADLLAHAGTGLLLFAFQPADAGAARAYTSARPVELGRWTHVAATYDGATVRIWINGSLDVQYASPGAIRRSDAPLELGNALDPR